MLDLCWVVWGVFFCFDGQLLAETLLADDEDILNGVPVELRRRCIVALFVLTFRHRFTGGVMLH